MCDDLIQEMSGGRCKLERGGRTKILMGYLWISDFQMILLFICFYISKDIYNEFVLHL